MARDDRKPGSRMGSSMKDRVKVRAQERKTGGGGTKFQNIPLGTSFFQAKKGAVNIDVIPYVISVDNHPSGLEKGELWYQRTIDVHFGVGPEEKSYLCRKTIGQRCPICEYAAKLRKSGNADDETLAALRPKEREIYNIIDLDNEDAGIQLFEMSYYLFGKLLETEINEGSDEYMAFAMPDEGMSLRVRFSEKQMGSVTFLETSRIDFLKRKKQYDMDIVEKAVDLDSILNVLSYEDLEAVFMGLDTSSTGEKSKPSPRKEEKEEKKAPKEEKEEKEEKKAPKEEKEEKNPPKEEEGSAPKCPNGGTFGVDTDDIDGCEKCKLWEQCIEIKEANN